MRLTGVHLLLTYECNFECDHCFVWGSPRQQGTMSPEQICEVLEQSKRLGTVEWVYFEGGEPFLDPPKLVEAVQRANRMGFRVGIVSNGFWATTVEEAMTHLEPLAGQVEDLSVSSDLYHADESSTPETRNAREAAQQLGIPVDFISIERPEVEDPTAVIGQTPAGDSGVMHRGRAAAKLSGYVAKTPWDRFTTCPFEDLREPERVHVDPLGNVHICQGISLGNLFRTPLEQICTDYIPEEHPITGPLLEGGPAALVRRFEVPHCNSYADSCHLCYEARRALRDRFPEILTPDQVYGEADAP
ncbi:MAG: radical SAM protein [Deltaproteobacteria bacterium]|nr:radical SAM protein [Deltaproteobacteria bacterium]MBW2693175.1 radical SAM protein [Deltaproteobacteria bacterium]